MSENGVALIAAERQRQIEEEGYSPRHDEMHIYAEMAREAATLASPSKIYYRIAGTLYGELGPNWGKKLTRPDPGAGNVHERHREICTPEVPENKTARINELTRAGALIAAEIDRLQRA